MALGICKLPRNEALVTKRKHVPLTTKLAACLAELQYLRGDPIPWKQLKVMTAHQLVSLYQWDHSVYAAWDGGEHYTNITPRLILAHREKTAKRDVPAIAKTKRIARKELQRIDVRGDRSDGHSSRPKLKKKWPKRSFAQQQRGSR